MLLAEHQIDNQIGVRYTEIIEVAVLTLFHFEKIYDKY